MDFDKDEAYVEIFVGKCRQALTLPATHFDRSIQMYTIVAKLMFRFINNCINAKVCNFTICFN